jgi:hypothetical protein
METSLVEEQNVEGREDGIVNVRKTDRTQERGLASLRCEEAGPGRPFLVKPFRAPRTLESQERFPERCPGVLPA